MKKILKLAILAIVILLISVFFILISQEVDYFENKITVETNSMSHGDKQDGIMDLGDIVLYSNVTEDNKIITWAEGKTINYEKWGNYGDVIVYYPYNDSELDVIIHRAMCWIEYNEFNNTYNVKYYELVNVSNVTIQELGLNQYMPNHSGFITKGDNELTNPVCDQAGNICVEPIKDEWILGKVYKIQEN